MGERNYLLLTTSTRSGSALLSRILNANPDVCLSNDKIKYFMYCYKRFAPLNPENFRASIDSLASRLSSRFNMNLDVKQIMSAMSGKELSEQNIVKTVFDTFFHDKPQKIIGEMECLAWTKIPFFLDHFPRSKAIIIYRDPRDVVVSFKKMTFAPGNDYLIQLFNSFSLLKQVDYLEENYADRFHGVKFEELKTDPENCIRKVCSFLGITFSPEMLRDDNWKEVNGVRWEGEKNSAFYESGSKDHAVALNPVGRWRELITPEDHFLTEWINKDVMIKRCYTPDLEKYDEIVFKNAIEKLLSSSLLRSAFQDWCVNGIGTEKYPVDPLDKGSGHQEYLSKLGKVAEGAVY